MRIERPGRASGAIAVLAIVIYCLIVNASAAAPTDTRAAAPKKQTKVEILGLAAVLRSVTHGAIEIYDDSGKLAYRFDASIHPAGYFQLALNDRRLFKKNDKTADFRVVLVNGLTEGLAERVTLMADVRDFDPAIGIVYLNPVTTLVSRYLDARPGLDLQQAEATVRTFLQLPDEVQLGRDITVGSRFFDPQAFLQRAALAGSLKSFMDKVFADLLAGRNQGYATTALGTSTSPQLVCINTFAFDSGSDPTTATPFVQVGDKRYDRAAAGMHQVVVLNRQNPLGNGTNMSFSDVSSLSNFLSGLDSSKLVIVAGGVVGTTVSNQTGLSTAVQKIGAAQLFQPGSSVETYSVIGVPGIAYGEAYQHAWWSLPSGEWVEHLANCGAKVDVDSTGNISGWLTRDTTGINYTYASPEYPTFDTRAPGSAPPLSNIVQIGNGRVLATLPANSAGGFHFFVYDARIGAVIWNHAYSTNIMQNGNLTLDRDGLATFLQDLSSTGSLLWQALPYQFVGMVTSIGKVSALDANDSNPTLVPTSKVLWGQVAAALQAKYGASAHVFNTLKNGDRYSMIGLGQPDPKLPAAFALQSAPLLLSASQSVSDDPVPTGRLFGYLERARSGYLRPVVAEPTGTTSYAITSVAYQSLSNWPHENTSGYLAANADIACQLQLGCSSGADVRKFYPDTTQQSLWGAYLSTLNLLSYSTMPQKYGPYSQSDFEDLRSDFRNEFIWVPKVWGLIGSMTAPFESTHGLDLVNIATNISNSLPPPPSNSTSSIFTDIGLTAALSASSYLPDVGTYFGLLQTGFEVMGKLNNTSSGSPQNQIRTTTEQLAQQTATAIEDAISEYGLLGGLLLADYGKLSTIARADTAGAWGIITEDTVLAAVSVLNNSYAQGFYGSLMPLAWPTYRLVVAYPSSGPNVPPLADANAYQCWNSSTGDYQKPAKNAPQTGQFARTTGYYGSGVALDGPQIEFWVWATSPLAISPGANHVPAASFTDPLFDSVDNGGYDLVAPIFWEQNFTPRTVTCDGHGGL